MGDVHEEEWPTMASSVPVARRGNARENEVNVGERGEHELWGLNKVRYEPLDEGNGCR